MYVRERVHAPYGRTLLTIILVAVACQRSWSAPQSEAEDGSDEASLQVGLSSPSWFSDWSREQKLVAFDVAAVGGLAAYGVIFWGYGGHSFQFHDEGWFGRSTDYGGADKLGHAYTSYLGVNLCSSLCEQWGYSREEAALYGFLTSEAFFTLLEVGDALSSYGFSAQDFVCDSLGSVFGYLRYRYPGLRERLDYRVEYFPSEGVYRGGHTDLATDYSGYKYLLALKLGGFDRLASTPLRYVELYGGYYTQGFPERDSEYFDDKTRTWYAGVGINLAGLARKAGWTRTSTVLTYYQPPYTYLSYDRDLSKQSLGVPGE